MPPRDTTRDPEEVKETEENVVDVFRLVVLLGHTEVPAGREVGCKNDPLFGRSGILIDTQVQYI